LHEIHLAASQPPSLPRSTSTTLPHEQEVSFLQKRDMENVILFTDLNDPDFKPEENGGVDYEAGTEGAREGGRAGGRESCLKLMQLCTSANVWR